MVACVKLASYPGLVSTVHTWVNDSFRYHIQLLTIILSVIVLVWSRIVMLSKDCHKFLLQVYSRVRAHSKHKLQVTCWAAYPFSLSPSKYSHNRNIQHVHCQTVDTCMYQVTFPLSMKLVWDLQRAWTLILILSVCTLQQNSVNSGLQCINSPAIYLKFFSKTIYHKHHLECTIALTIANTYTAKRDGLF